MNTATQAETLLSQPEFVKCVNDGVVASDLRSMYAPDRSIRWVQMVAKTVRELPEPDKENRPVAPDWTKALDAERVPRIPVAPTKPMTGWFKLTGDFAIVSDLHIPFHHAPTLENLMDDAEKVGINRLIIGGDTFDFNMFHHGPRGAAYQRRGQDDVEEGRLVLKGLLEYFKHIYIIMGNHDLYLAKDLRNHFDPEFLFSKFFGEFSDRIAWSSYGHCDIVSGGVKWKVCHGANFSEANPIAITMKLAEKFSCNVISGHQHRVQESFGKYHCVALGGAMDPTRMGYLTIEPTINAEPKRSYALLKDGWCQHVIERP